MWLDKAAQETNLVATNQGNDKMNGPQGRAQLIAVRFRQAINSCQKHVCYEANQIHLCGSASGPGD